MYPGSELVWQRLESKRKEKSFFAIKWEVHRAKVPGGWLVLARSAGAQPVAMTFYPDPDHRWSGGSLP